MNACYKVIAVSQKTDDKLKKNPIPGSIIMKQIKSLNERPMFTQAALRACPFVLERFIC